MLPKSYQEKFCPYPNILTKARTADLSIQTFICKGLSTLENSPLELHAFWKFQLLLGHLSFWTISITENLWGNLLEGWETVPKVHFFVGTLFRSKFILFSKEQPLLYINEYRIINNYILFWKGYFSKEDLSNRSFNRRLPHQWGWVVVWRRFA